MSKLSQKWHVTLNWMDACELLEVWLESGLRSWQGDLREAVRKKLMKGEISTDALEPFVPYHVAYTWGEKNR